MYFFDRTEAGRKLGERLAYLRGQDVVVLGLPRGGVPVAAEVADALGAPLDVIMVRKLGVPAQPELGMGAIGEGGVRVLNRSVMAAVRVDERALQRVEEREAEVLRRRAEAFRGDRPPVSLKGRTAVVVDDGIATGSTAIAACQVARAHGASRIVLATPVAPPGVLDRLAEEADEVVCLEAPEVFFAIGEFYSDFTQVSDDEVVALLQGRASAGEAVDDRELEIPLADMTLMGRLGVPEGAHGFVVFAHGTGSGRNSPRNNYVAGVLRDAGLGTLLLDLLTVNEQDDRAKVFDVPLLAGRLEAALAWLLGRPEARDARLGLFGASTGAAAALWTAARPESRVDVVVSRGGRPDLASDRLAEVRAPTLLIVGGRDEVVLDLNRRAQALMRCETKLAVVPGATHLFEEPGALEEVARLARDWFVEHLGRKITIPDRSTPAGRG